MPATKEKKFSQSVIGSDRYGAGGEPPAPPPGILERVPDEIRRQLPDDVIDALLAGAKTEEEIVGPGGVVVAGVEEIAEPEDVPGVLSVFSAVPAQAVSARAAAARSAAAQKRDAVIAMKPTGVALMPRQASAPAVRASGIVHGVPVGRHRVV